MLQFWDSFLHRRGEEPENTFGSIPPICHVLGKLYDDLGSPERGPSLWALVAYHLVAPAILCFGGSLRFS